MDYLVNGVATVHLHQYSFKGMFCGVKFLQRQKAKKEASASPEVNYLRYIQ